MQARISNRPLSLWEQFFIERVEIVFAAFNHAFQAAPAFGGAFDVGEETGGKAIKEAEFVHFAQEFNGSLQNLVCSPRHKAVLAPFELLAEITGRVKDVESIADGEEAVLQEGSVNGLGGHAEQLDALARQDAHEIEESVEHMPAKDITRHMLCRRHILDRIAGEEVADQLRRSNLV